MGDEKVEIINDLDTQKVITITIPDTSQSLTIGNNFLDESLITKLGVLVMDNAHLLSEFLNINGTIIYYVLLLIG